MKLVKIASLLCVASLAVAAESPAGLRIALQLMGTPEFIGPPKIDQPGFVAPIVESVFQPDRAACLESKRAGSYEATIGIDGVVTGLHSRHEPVEGDECEKRYLFPYLAKWRFRPATYQGKATPVYMRFELSR